MPCIAMPRRALPCRAMPSLAPPSRALPRLAAPCPAVPRRGQMWWEESNLPEHQHHEMSCSVKPGQSVSAKLRAKRTQS